jgi:hypothetical protein
MDMDDEIEWEMILRSNHTVRGAAVLEAAVFPNRRRLPIAMIDGFAARDQAR